MVLCEVPFMCLSPEVLLGKKVNSHVMMCTNHITLCARSMYVCFTYSESKKYNTAASKQYNYADLD